MRPSRMKLLSVATTLLLPVGLLSVTGPAGAAEPDSLRVETDLAPGAARTLATSESHSTPAPRAGGLLRRSVNLTGAVSLGATTDERRLSSATVTQDLTSRRITAVVRLRATPSSANNSASYVNLGVWNGSTCQQRVLIVGGTHTTTGGGSFYNTAGAPTTPLGATASRNGATVTVTSAAHPTIGSAAWNCAYVGQYPSTGATAENVYSGLTARSLSNQFRPVLQLKAGPPVVGAPGRRWTKVRVKVRNHSEGTARNVRVTAAGKGLQFKPKTRRLGTLDRYRTKEVTFQVRTRTARARPLRFTARAAEATPRNARVTVARAAKPRKINSIAGRYYWGFKTGQVSTGWDNVALWFTNGRFVHVGFPARGKPSCKRVTKKCKRYTFNRRTGRVTIRGLGSGKVNSQSLTVRGQRYSPLTLPRAGQRFNVSLIHRNFSGCCLNTVSFSEWLILDRKGRFVRSSLTIGSIGAPGVGTVGSVVGPGKRGRYQILKGGRIRLKYANGRTRIHPIGIEHDVRNKPSPRGAGLVVGDTNYYWE